MAKPNDEMILHLLKARGPQTAAALGKKLGITAVGARQHLNKLQALSLVEPEDRREAVGRPKRYWQLSEHGHARFPDTHAHLTLEILEAARDVFGDAGLDRLIAKRERDTLAVYKRETEGCADLAAKVRRLTKLRQDEGYMAEWRREKNGGFLLIENHCPICAAAATCQGLCRSELDVFRAVIGPEATVERTDHILAGARRCAYRITPA